MPPHAGVFASTDTRHLQLPLPASAAAGDGSPKAALRRECTARVPLYVTAGSLPQPHGSSASALHHHKPTLLAVTLSYWCEACQPTHHAIKGLTDPAQQALGRQVTRWLEVTVQPNLRVASILAEHSAAGEPQGRNSDADPAHLDRRTHADAAVASAARDGSLLLKLQLARTNAALGMQVRMYIWCSTVDQGSLSFSISNRYVACALLMSLNSTKKPVTGLFAHGTDTWAA